jgi:hypothetical protein
MTLFEEYQLWLEGKYTYPDIKKRIISGTAEAKGVKAKAKHFRRMHEFGGEERAKKNAVKKAEIIGLRRKAKLFGLWR